MFRNSHILLGGCLLALGASVVNVVFLLQTGTSVSHLTGDISKLAADIVRASPEMLLEAQRVGLAAGGFIAGAVSAGFLIHQSNLELSRPYGRTILFIGALLLGTHWLMPVSDRGAITVAAFACGLQNALATRFRGIVLRTTHLTGLLTDFGAAIGMKLRGHPVPRHGIVVPAAISFSYFAGAFAGCLGAVKFRLPLLPIVGGAYLLGGVCWSVVKRLPPRTMPDA